MVVFYHKVSPELAEFKTWCSWTSSVFSTKSTLNHTRCADCSGYSIGRHANNNQDIEERQEARVYCGIEAGPFGSKEVPHPLGTVPGATHPVQLQNIVPVEVSDVLVVTVWLSVDREISGYAQSRDGTRLFIHDRYLWIYRAVAHTCIGPVILIATGLNANLFQRLI